ncbi:two-component system response regulator YesN [Paenibacillus taihuensis]|uniref:Two-component system response regulator YesN n=1 Tax=Paenibacillus taihuensis TaxID=1156355 RepID=A0A3D9QW99_9BACL|nr:response regulator [Paenibacillus taihuensis]REE69677.1 two-component system response regulator YesN [Paenibacillus taihuensis]
MSYRILLVDDEQMIKLSLRKIISETHPDFVIVGDASDGQEALGLAARERPHVIITDISMPVMGGLELIRHIHESGEPTEIVILSGYGEFDYAQEAIRCGVADYILKPMRVSAVKELMLKLYAKHLERIESMQTRSSLSCEFFYDAEALFEMIWKTDEASVLAEAARVQRKITGSELQEEQKRSILLDLAAALQRQAELRGASVAFELQWSERLEELCELFRSMLLHAIQQVRSSRNWGKHPAIREAVQVIESRYADPNLKLDELLNQLGMSVTHFYNLFKQETGKSFITYLIEYRMDEAKALLERNREMKTYEIGERVGYPDYPHFTKLFKKTVGVTPSEYKKLLV